MNKLELLKQKLEQARKELNEKGYHYSSEMYSKGGYNELMKIKPFEIAYQDVIEEIWPDEVWWKVLNYWDIFDAMAFEGLDDAQVIDEIIKHVDNSFLEESCKIEEGDSSFKDIETKCGCKIEDGHTVSEYMKKYGDEYENGELWDFSLEDFKNGAVEPQKGLVYWLVKDRDGELRVFETTEECKECPESCKSLKEGTSNFGWLRNFPLLVFYTYDEIMYQIKHSDNYPQLEDFTEDKGNGDFHVDYDAYYEACDKFEEESFNKVETAVLDEDQVEQLEDAIYDFNEETKRIAEDLYDAGNEDDYYVLKDIQLKVEPGYYEATYIDVDDERDFDNLSDKVEEEQLKRFKDFFNKLKSEHGLSHYEVAWGPASNGETGYKKVESLKESKVLAVKDVKPGQSFKPLKDLFYCDINEEGMFEDNEELLKEFTDNGFKLEDTSLIIPAETVIKFTVSQSVDSYEIGDYGFDVGEWSEEALNTPIEIINEESLKEEKEYLSDKVSKVLDDYGILYGDIVENGDGTVNIVGVDIDEWEEAQSALENELGVSVLVPDYDHEEFDDELIVTESKKKDCHVNTNAGDPIKNAEFFNASMGTSGEGSVGENLEESKEEDKSLDDIDADKDDKKELAKQEYEKEVDDADADRDDKLEKEESLEEDKSKEQINEDLTVTTNDVTVHVDPTDAVTTIESSEGSVVVQHSNGDVTVNTDSGVTVNTSEGVTDVDVNKVEEVTAEVETDIVSTSEDEKNMITGDEMMNILDKGIDIETGEVVDNTSTESNEVKEESLEEKHVCEKCGKSPCECDKQELKEEPVVNLDTRYDSRDSFYGKAKVDVKDDGSQILYSYNTPVCYISKDGEVKLLRKGYLGWFSSPTTLRHVKEFLKQNGKEVGTKAQLNKMYHTEDAYDYVK